MDLLFVLPLMLPYLGSTQGFGRNLMKIPDNDRSQAMCSTSLLRKYFNSGNSLSGSVLYVSLTSASMHTQNCLLEAIHGLTDFPWSVVIRDAKAPNLGAVLHEKPQCYFVVIENLEDEDLEDIFEDWKTTINWNPLAQFVVYLASIEETDEEMTELMMEILLSFMNMKIYNVNVIGQNEENGHFYGKTVFPYHPDNNCGNRVISVETLDICNYQEEENMADGVVNSEEYEDKGTRENKTGDEKENEGSQVEANEEGDNYDDGKNTNDESYYNTSNNQGNTDYDDTKSDDKEDNAKNDEGSIEDNIEEPYGNYENHAHDQKFDNDYTPDNENRDGLNKESQESSENNNRNIHKNLKDSNQVNDDDNVTDMPDEYKDNSDIIGENNENKQKINQYDIHRNYYESSTELLRQNITNNNSKENDKSLSTFVHFKNVITKAILDKESKNNCLSVENIERNYRILHKSTSQLLISSSYDFLKRNHEKRIESIENFKRNDLKARNKRRWIGNYSQDEGYNNTDDREENPKPKLYLEEIHRALFFDKFPKDLSGCPLAAAYRPWEPYIFTEMNKNEKEEADEEDYNADGNYLKGSNSEESQQGYQIDTFMNNDSFSSELGMSGESEIKAKLSGIEYQLLQTISDRLHISIDLQVENRNLYHLFQQLIDGDIEMIIGGIDEDPSISQFVSTTIPYHQDDLTWCVAKARRSYGLFNFLASFSPFVWLLTFIFAVIAATSIAIMQKLLRTRSKNLHGYFGILFRVIGTVFSQSVPLVKLPDPIRLTFAATFFMGFMFTNSYQSFLVSTLTTPKSAYQISRVEEIYQQRMNIMGSVENVRHLSKPGEVFQYIREKFQMCYNIEECLRQAAHNERLAVAVSRQHSFYNPRIPRNQLYCFSRNENLYVYLVTMLLPKNFHLLHKINPIIQYVIESGHMQKWARDLDMRRRIMEERSHIYEEAFRSLTFSQIAGSFVFKGAMLAFACLILILECWVHRLSTRRHYRTRLKIVKYLHRKFQQA